MATPERIKSALAAAAANGLPNLDLSRWEDMIHAITWQVGRAFSFQAFNPCPSAGRMVAADGPATAGGHHHPNAAFTPAAIFVASDHLSSLLLKDVLPRDAATACADAGWGSSPAERFARSVWALHTQIFYSYDRRWCVQVGLPTRSLLATGVLAGSDPRRREVIHGLLLELALFLLIHTEVINLRHTAEVVWFIFWALNLSPVMAGLWQAGPPQALLGGQAKLAHLRNVYQDAIAAALGTFDANQPYPLLQPSATTVLALRTMLQTVLSSCTAKHIGRRETCGDRVQENSRREDVRRCTSGESHDRQTSCELADAEAAAAAAAATVAVPAEDLDILAELAAGGDGGMFMDRIISPVFTMLAHEMDFMTAQGEEVPHRIGYDDLNESCCDAERVHAALSALGLTREQRTSGEPNQAYHALLLVGCPSLDHTHSAVALAEAVIGGCTVSPAGCHNNCSSRNGGREAADNGMLALLLRAPFNVQRAANFWSLHVATKTFRERRTLLALYRAFYRVFALHLVGFVMLMAHAFDPWDRRLLSTGILTHALCHAVERLANWWISRNPTSPLTAKDARERLAAGSKKGDSGEGNVQVTEEAAPLVDVLSADPRVVRALRPIVRIEGAPVWGVCGFLEWWVLLGGLIAIYVLQYDAPNQGVRSTLGVVWLYITWGYPLAILVHFALTTRDGYCVSLTHALRLPAFITASSARPKATRWLEGRMRMGWVQFLVNCAMWCIILGIKFTFDYYALCKPLVGPIREILQASWFTDCVDERTQQATSECINGAWILVAARVAPFFVMSLLDTSFFYAAVLTGLGVLRGIFVLDLGLVSTWTHVTLEFHHSPARWWDRCLSQIGRHNALRQFSSRSSVANATVADSNSATTLMTSIEHAAKQRGNSVEPQAARLAGQLSGRGDMAPGLRFSRDTSAKAMQTGSTAGAAAAAAAAAATAHVTASAAVAVRQGASDMSITLLDVVPAASGADLISSSSSCGGNLEMLTPDGGRSGGGDGVVPPSNIRTVPRIALALGTAEVVQGGVSPVPGVPQQAPLLPAAPASTPPTVCDQGVGGERRVVLLAEGLQAEGSQAGVPAGALPGSRGPSGLHVGGFECSALLWHQQQQQLSLRQHHPVNQQQSLVSDRQSAASELDLPSPEQLHLAMRSSFASAWDCLVADLREMDLLSDREEDNLRFLRLEASQPDVSRAFHGSLLPVLLPTFFYAGKLQSVIDTGVCKAPHAAAVNELRILFVALLSGLGMLTQPQAAALQDVSFIAMHSGLQHQDARLKALAAGLEFVDLLLGVSTTAQLPTNVKPIATAFHNLLKGIEREALHIKSWRLKWGEGCVDAIRLLAITAELRGKYVADAAALARCLRSLLPHAVADAAAAAEATNLYPHTVVADVAAAEAIKLLPHTVADAAATGATESLTHAFTDTAAEDAKPLLHSSAVPLATGATEQLTTRINDACVDEFLPVAAAGAATTPLLPTLPHVMDSATHDSRVQQALHVMDSQSGRRTPTCPASAALASSAASAAVRSGGQADDHPLALAVTAAAPCQEQHDAARQVLRQVLQVVRRMMTVTQRAAAPQSPEARRVLGFFVNSLGSRRMPGVPSVDLMRSLVVMTPCYEEDVLYSLDARETAQQLGIKVSEEQLKATVDLLSDTAESGEEGMSLVSYLRSLFPGDYENLIERVRKQASVPPDIILTEEDFRGGRRLAGYSLELQMWASNRGQLLARTVKGMMCYGRAFKLLARMDHPRPDGLDPADYETWLDALVSQKFKHLVAAQVYSKCLKSKDLRHRWLAESTNVLLRRYPALRVAYLDSAPSPSGTANYSVLIRGGMSSGVDTQLVDPRVPFEATEVYRVRLPTNNFSGRGIIIGEGKPENQNHAVIFAFGEAVQAIDMNQDNYLAEALKMRNLLVTLDPTQVWTWPWRRPRDPWEMLYSPPGQAPRRSGGTPCAREEGPMSGSRMLLALQEVKEASQPTVLVGFREWVFSEKAGALGSYAAAAEFAFGTIFQRIMSWPGGVRMHYGHPDVWNKMETMTQGGMSRATRTIHVSEDVFSGYCHTLRGARIKYEEFISCGKGRDMGFDSINMFEAKVSGGGGETIISREMWRICARMDFFRVLHFYFSGSGYFINNFLLFVSTYLLIYSILLLAMARANDVLGPDGGPTRDTINLNFAIQLGLISDVPYMGQLMLESGPIKTTIIIAVQFLSGSIMFFIFRQLTSAYYFAQDMMYGGASYISTGRGFNLQASSFVKVYSNYARTHLYFAFELLLWCIVLAICMECSGSCNYPGLTWGTYMVSVSLLLAPFWFNPLSFDLPRLLRDAKGFSVWLHGAYEPSVRGSWHSWNRQQNVRIRDIHQRQADRWLTQLALIATQCVPVFLLGVATVSRLKVKSKFDSLAALSNQWLVFVVMTASYWLLMAASLWLYERAKGTREARLRRLLRLLLALVPLGLSIAYLVLPTYIFNGTWGTVAIMIYANFNFYLVAQRALLHASPPWTPAVHFVDFGFWIIDFLAGYLLLGFVLLLAALGLGFVQTRLLFNADFVRYLAEGRMLRLLAPRLAPRAHGEGGDAATGGDSGAAVGGVGGGLAAATGAAPHTRSTSSGASDVHEPTITLAAANAGKVERGASSSQHSATPWCTTQWSGALLAQPLKAGTPRSTAAHILLVRQGAAGEAHQTVD